MTPAKSTLKLSLKPGERIYLNGAVVRVDRKVTLELLNDVQFLLEGHVLQAEDASTPLRQLYFLAQIMLINPQGAEEAREMFRHSLPLLLASFHNQRIRSTLKDVDRMVSEDRIYEALRAIRSLYPLEKLALETDENEPQDAPRPLAVGAR